MINARNGKSHKTKARVLMFAVVASVLVCANLVFSFLALRANHNAADAFEERNTLVSAVYETNIAAGAFTRMARYYAMVGDTATYDLFFAEVELDRYGRKRELFTAFGAPAHEIELMETLIYERLRMFAIHYEVVQLRFSGYVQESIAVGHGPAVAQIGGPLGGMADDLSALVYERTMLAAARYQRIAGIFSVLTVILAVILAFGGGAVLIFVGKAGLSWRVEIFGALMLISACFGVFFTLSANFAADEKFSSFEHQHALSIASYNAERGGEILTRLSRMHVVTGGQMQYNQYFAELERDRFGHALETFILMSAPSNEVNMMVDVLGRLTLLRQIEARSILLRSTGYYQEAIDTAFGPDVAALDRPLGDLGEEIRETVNARTNVAIDAAARSHNAFARASIIIAILLAISVFGILITLKSRKESAPGITVHIFQKIDKGTIRAKLFASFAIVILLFTAQVGISMYYDNQINLHTRHHLYYLTARSETIWAAHQEFTEMRRHIRETFLSPTWMGAANEADRIGAELYLSSSHARLTYLAQIYVASVGADILFPQTPDDSRIVVLSEAMSYIDRIYALFTQNFFLDGNMSFYIGDAAGYPASTEVLFGLLRRFIDANREISESNIETYRYFSTAITVSTLALTFVLAVLLAFSMLRAFDRRVSAIMSAADNAARGELDAELHGSDEISVAFSKLSGVFNRDILEKKAQLQIAQEINDAKSRFLARMSHEIRTPIASVMGISEIQLRSPDLTPVTEESFAKIYDSSNMLLGIVNDILDLSKIEAGKMELLCEKYQVESLISDAVAPYIAHLDNKDIAFDLHVDENLPALLIGDALRIKQIINNILSNAFKYTDSGSVGLEIMCENADDSAVLIITISDTGMGMTKEQLDSLFSDYTRFHEQEMHDVTGTGLGMPIVYSLAQIMDAEIDVESEAGKGTVVTVRIPQQTAGSEILGAKIAQSLQQFEMSRNFSEKKFKFTPEPMPYGKVLVVDDVYANLYVAKGLLAFYGINVETCESGYKAIEKIEGGSVYDIIFMDQMMPGMSGTETMHKLRKAGYTAPIVALTANALIGQAEESIKSGFDGFISKPIQTMHLNTILHRFIKDKQPPEIIEAAQVADSGVLGDIDGYMSSADLADVLRADFVASHKDTFSRISQALDSGNIPTAHRLAHTLKGVAGLIQEPELVRLAGDMEDLLREAQVPAASQLDALENELERVLKGIEITETTTPADNPDETKNSILIVDDEPMNITALVHILGHDYTIFAAKSGSEAIDLAKECKPDLVLLDVIMPDLSGHDVITKLKQMSETRDIPVIFVTGLSSAADKEKGLSLGAVDYIIKPFTPSDVRLRVENQVKNSQICQKDAGMELSNTP
ncbi:MAG: response regulator [Defluviitaleaceae bacterium]|nr:response regulator [Defluviitaleaceae bacterium]